MRLSLASVIRIRCGKNIISFIVDYFHPFVGGEQRVIEIYDYII